MPAVLTLVLVFVLSGDAAPSDRPVRAERAAQRAVCEAEAELFDGRVARWCPAVAHYFGDEWTHWALHIIECESGGDPEASNPRSSATGLFQHLARYWPDRARKAGWEGAARTDPEANIAVSAWLLAHGGTSHWKCKAGHAVP